MFTYKIENDELKIKGTMEQGKSIISLCCEGHKWIVSVGFPDPDPAYASVWGVCQNPECPEGEPGNYPGVSNFCQEDIALWIDDNKEVIDTVSKEMR